MVINSAESPEHEVASMASTLRLRLFCTAMPTALLFAPSCAPALSPSMVAQAPDAPQPTQPSYARSSGTSAPAPLFLHDPGTPPPPGMLPTPYIGRATEGVLSVDKSGCVYVTGRAGEYLIIWPSDAVFEPRDSTFQTKRSGVLRFGDRLSFTGNPAGPLEMSRIGNVHVPEVCRRMNTLFVAPDGARRL
jgi:hypothetical protein